MIVEMGRLCAGDSQLHTGGKLQSAAGTANLDSPGKQLLKWKQ